MNRFDYIKKDMMELEVELSDLAEFLHVNRNNENLTLEQANDVIRQAYSRISTTINIYR